MEYFGTTAESKDLTPKEAIPTKTSELTNDSGFATGEQVIGMQNGIAAINEKIPTRATVENKLADKDFVNSSISTATAAFKGTFNSVESLPTTDVDNNDYAFVVTTDAGGNTLYNRYKFDGSAWSFEFALNNSSFTAEQWASINSGITQPQAQKIESVVHYASKTVRGSGFSKSTGWLMGILHVWSTPREANYYASPDDIISIYAPDVKVSNGTFSANADGVIDISSAIAGEIANMVGTELGNFRSEIYPYISNNCVQKAPAKTTALLLVAAGFNDLGTLTANQTLTLPAITNGTAPEFNGQFTTGGTYTVIFPTGIVMIGDTTQTAGTYQFSICNGYGVIIKVA